MSEDVVIKDAEIVEPVEEAVTPKTIEEKVDELEKAMRQTVTVCNNLIQFCNTIERWRRMEFLTEEEIQKRKEEDDAKLAESSDTPSE